MLRITVTHQGSDAAIDLEGRLVGDWVGELRTAWLKLTAPSAAPSKVWVSLKGLTCVDCEGRALLEQMYRSGVQMRATGLKMSGLVEEIQNCCDSELSGLRQHHHQEKKTPDPS